MDAPGQDAQAERALSRAQEHAAEQELRSSIRFHLFRLPFGCKVKIGSKPDNDICIFTSPGRPDARTLAVLDVPVSGWPVIRCLSDGNDVWMGGNPVSVARMEPGQTAFVSVSAAGTELADKAILMIQPGLRMILLPGVIGLLGHGVSFTCRLEPEPDPAQPPSPLSVIHFNPDQATGPFPFMPGTEPPTALLEPYVRSPRLIPSVDPTPIRIDGPPPPAYRSQGEQAASPGSRNSLLERLPLIRSLKARERERADIFRRDRYLVYLDRKRDQLAQRSARVRQSRETRFPAPAHIPGMLADSPGSRRIYERSPADDDFSTVRVGTGRMPSGILITTPPESPETETDTLSREPMRLRDAYEMLESIPVTLSFRRERVVGLVGDKALLHPVLRSLILQLCAFHAPDELKLAIVASPEELARLDWVRRLPHVVDASRTVRLLAETVEETHRLFRHLSEQVDKPGPMMVLLLLEPALVEQEPLLRKCLESAGQEPSQDRITALFAYGRMERLPQSCRTILQLEENQGAMYVREDNRHRLVPFCPDAIGTAPCAEFAGRLGRLRYRGVEPDQPLPDRLSFLSLHRVGHVEALDVSRQWQTSRPDHSLAVPVGVRTDGQPFLMDLHESWQGPHGLVAGMTGSGKSGFLQTWLLSLAVRFHPHEVSFLLIDYKGGGMANALAGLPHVAGSVTNLSGGTLYRALRAVRAELKRRQQLLADAGFLHIDAYLRAWKDRKAYEPMPHLFVVCDEFAQLRAQHPAFLRELTDIAQIGRSLGFHLVLATQKPAGVVDEQIWGNARFRACLKVLDRQDSLDMIHRSDATTLRQAGRCFVQVGNDEYFGEIQTAYAMDPYRPAAQYAEPEERSLQLVDSTGFALRTVALEEGSLSGRNGLGEAELLSERNGPVVGELLSGRVGPVEGERASSTRSPSPTGVPSQLEAVVEMVSRTARQLDLQTPALWLPPLPEWLSLDDVRQYPKVAETPLATGSPVPDGILAAIGLSDDPDRQRQEPVLVSFGSQGNLAVFGIPGSGRTTLLQTLLFSLSMRYTPQDACYDVFDLESRTLGCFMATPHCGRVVYVEDETGIMAVLDRLTVELGRRRFLFSERDVGSWSAYRQATGAALPMRLLVIDSLPVLRERYPQVSERLHVLAREGPACGIHLVATGTTRASMPHQILDYVRNILVLQQHDRFQYRELLGDTGGLEPDGIAGRGLHLQGGCRMFQTALAVPERLDAERIRQIRERLADKEEMSEMSVLAEMTAMVETSDVAEVAEVAEATAMVETAEVVEG